MYSKLLKLKSGQNRLGRERSDQESITALSEKPKL